MSTPPNHPTRTGQSSSVPPIPETSYLSRRALHGQVVMVPEAGHYPQSQRPDITTAAVLRFLESVQGRP